VTLQRCSNTEQKAAQKGYSILGARETITRKNIKRNTSRQGSSTISAIQIVSGMKLPPAGRNTAIIPMAIVPIGIRIRPAAF